MVRNIMALALTSCLASTAFAAKKVEKPVVWSQEPTSFMGINLNGDIVYDIPECPRMALGQFPQDLCRGKSYTANYYSIEGLPKIGLTYSPRLGAMLLDRKIQSLYLTGNTRDFDKVKELFITKYGQPTASAVQQVKTKAGASFANDVLAWKGAHVTITLSRYADDINSFGAAISNNEVEAKAAGKQAGSNAEAASKL